MRRLLLGIAILSGSLAGCRKHATEPPPGSSGGVSPLLIATQPQARATGVLYDTDIWAQFDRALDGRTISTQSVFFRLDGQRIASTITYDGITRRIFVRPTPVLELQRTYTVEFSTAVKGVDGVALPEGVFFQFTTNSLRRVAYDYPAPATMEGPVATLGWAGPQAPVTNLLYEVYASTDSLAVQQRTAPMLQRAVFKRLVPATTWPLGSRVFWSVTSENLTTGERLKGPISSFYTIDPSTPLDSVSFFPLDHGSSDVRVRNSQFCGRDTLPCGPSFNGAMHWTYGSIGPDARFSSVTVRLVMKDNYANAFARLRPALWMAQNDWPACAIVSPGPPWPELSGFLAAGQPRAETEIAFESDRLAAFMEAQYRSRALLHGMLVRTEENMAFYSSLFANSARVPRVVVRFYRLPRGTHS